MKGFSTILGALAAMVAAVGCTQPQAGAGLVLTGDQEAAIGSAGAREAARLVGGRLDQPAVQAYVSTVGERVARSMGPTPWTYRFTVLAAGEPRVFGLPGGQIFVTRGLLEQLESEAELAALMAREMAHRSHRDEEALAKLSPQDMASAAAAAAVLMEPRGQPPKHEAESLARLVDVWSQISYTPAMKAEADRLGLDYMVAAGYDPAEMIRLVDALVRAQGRLGDPQREESVRQTVSRKYADHGGRIGRQEYQREVLDRLRPR
jgi:beta-barrel assembly-enhancing protease